jgi:predicted nucleic acid-binding protein
MIFDSDVLIWLSRGDPDAIAWVESTPDRALSVVTLMEILQGVRSRTEMQQTQASLRNLGFRVLPLSQPIGHLAAGLIEEHTLAHGLHMPDALIAATAIEAGEVLATANLRHFRPIQRLALKPFHPRRR